MPDGAKAVTNGAARRAIEAQVDAFIVGAGFGGLYAIHRLREAGLLVLAVDAAPEVGGTWYWNRYPGARCDVPSVYYAYSFSEELRREWKWSEFHAAQPEILDYARFVADKFDLRRSVLFETRVESVHFDEAASRWDIRTDRGDHIRARYVVMATGNLSVPHKPDIPGIDTFTGEILFTATWPEHDVGFRGKRVGVIGTGSSGIQVIPIVAEQADQLVVFQRTPNFSLPARNRTISGAAYAKMEADLPRHVAQLDVGRVHHRAPGEPVPPRAEQWEKYTALWERGGASFLGQAYPTMYADEEINQGVSDFVRERIGEIVGDPEIARALSPTDYPFGVKRPCFDTNYYATFNRSNVKLVNLRKEPIAEITPRGVRTEANEYELDTLIVATGFDAMTGALMAIDIRGRSGLTLKGAWADGPKAYLGIAAAGFPNMFMLTGPGSLSVIGNVLLNNEHHVDWMVNLIAHAEKQGAGLIEAQAEAQDQWMQRVRDVASSALFMKASSWYLGANIPGKPQVFMPYVGPGYRAHCAAVAQQGYPGIALGKVPEHVG